MYKLLICQLLIFIVIFVVKSLAVQCGDGQCEQDECCVLGRMRYSYESCVKLRKEGEACRPGDELDSNRVYDVLCPCNKGLKCVRGEDGATCQIAESHN